MTAPDRATHRLPAPGERPLPTWPGEYVDVGGQRIHVRRVPEASGEPTLYVHGLGGASTNWTDLGWLLADRLDGVALDLPGFGRSDPPPGKDYSLDRHVGVVERFVEQEGRTPVHLLGNSLGGAVVTRLAAQRPDLVRTVTLISPALPVLRPRRGTNPGVALPALPGIGRLVQQMLARMTPEDRMRGVVKLCFGDPARVPPERFEEAVAELSRRRDLPWYDEALVRSLRGLLLAFLGRGDRSLWRQAARIDRPTLVIWGRRDKLVSAKLAARAGRTFPHARVLVLPDCGHVAMMEDPETVADAVRALVDAGSSEGESR